MYRKTIGNDFRRKQMNAGKTWIMCKKQMATIALYYVIELITSGIRKLSVDI